MEPDPDMEELLRACDSLMQYLNEEEGEEWVCFAYAVRPPAPSAHDEVDNQAASLLIAKLSSID